MMSDDEGLLVLGPWVVMLSFLNFTICYYVTTLFSFILLISFVPGKKH